MVLICNDQRGAIQVLDHLGDYNEPLSQARLIRMHCRGEVNHKNLSSSDHWSERVAMLNQYSPERELDLGDDELA
jgi:beta-N-acetylhexosaminidase